MYQLKQEFSVLDVKTCLSNLYTLNSLKYTHNKAYITTYAVRTYIYYPDISKLFSMLFHVVWSLMLISCGQKDPVTLLQIILITYLCTSQFSC